MDKKYLSLNDLSAYKIAFDLANYVWEVVSGWDYLAKDTLGKQFIRSVDSMSANVAEGFGRYGKKDKISFYRYSYGSVKEAQDWNEKARLRGLISQKVYQYIAGELSKLSKKLNSLIKFTSERLTI